MKYLTKSWLETLRRVVGVVGCICVYKLFEYLAWNYSNFLAELFGYSAGLSSDFPGDTGTSADFEFWVFWLATGGLAACAALTFAVVFFERSRPQWGTQILYWGLLVIVMPMSLLNLTSGDFVFSRKLQAIVNLVLIFISSVCAINLLRMRATSTAVLVLRSMAFVLLLFQGVFVPAIYGLIWWLNQIGAISPASARLTGDGFVASVAAIASACIALAQYFHDSKVLIKPRVPVNQSTVRSRGR